MSNSPKVIFTPQLVDQVGEIGQVLGTFLESQTSRIQKELERQFPNVYSTAVKKLLNAFVTLEGTKRPLAKRDIQIPNLNQQQTELCLDQLEKARILRFEDGVYELAHDTLALRIVEDRSAEDIAFLEITKLVKDRFNVYSTSNALLNANELALVMNNKKRLKEELSFSESEWNFINKSTREIRKRKLILTSVTVVIVAILTAFSIFSFQQRRVAQAKEQEALLAKKEVEANLKKIEEEQKERTKAQFEKHLANGKTLMAQNEYQAAIQEFSTAIAINATLPDGNLGEEEAIKLKNEAENKTGAKARFDQLIRKGDAYLSQGEERYYEARNSYRAALQLGYNNSLAQSKVNSLKPKIEEAFADFKKKGDIFFRAKGFDLALDSYKKALLLKENDSYIKEQIKLCNESLN